MFRICALILSLLAAATLDWNLQAHSELLIKAGSGSHSITLFQAASLI